MWQKAIVEAELESSSNYFLSPPVTKERVDYVTIGVIIISATVVVILTIELKIVPFWINFLKSSPYLKHSLYPLAISVGILIIGIIFRTVLWFSYKPLTLEETCEFAWPYLSVIIPAYNEEGFILEAIDSIFAADYPQEKLEVIVIDDGSTDGTFEKLSLAKIKYGARIHIIRFQENLGKRKALYTGVKVSRGEVIVTIDSDSRIEQSALKNIVVPFIKEPKIGAVAGRVAVFNEKESLVTRMLAVKYSFSFDFGRAYQSAYGGVLVCPGALTAYRREALLPILEQWVNQVFMGKVCTHGEDRSLTNLILKSGYLTKYQSNAVVYTRVPRNFVQMSKMYVRWTRSSIRESFVLATFMFSRFRGKIRYLTAFDFFFLNFLYPFHLLIVALVFYSIIHEPLFIITHLIFLAIIFLFLSTYHIRTQRSLSFLYGIPLGVLASFCLWWVFPYSLLTLNEPAWLTR